MGRVTGDQPVVVGPVPARALAPSRPRGSSRPARDVAGPEAATVTAEIPVVQTTERGGRARPVRGTDEWYATRARPAPYVVRLAVWLLSFVLVLLLAGRAVEHYHPAWLDFLRNTTPAGATTSLAPSARRHSPGAPLRRVTATPAGFRLVSSSATGTTYAVPSQAYSVVVTTSARCWTQIAAPAGSTAYRYAQTVAPSESPKAFALTGSSTVVVDHTVTSIRVEIGGTSVGTITSPKVGYPYSFRPTTS